MTNLKARSRRVRRTIVSKSEEETRRLAAEIGRAARAGDVICLKGPLGSGKTRFVQGFARGAGFKGRVVSPTFGLAREYRAPRLNIYHLDLFRIKEREIPNLGLDEYLADPRGVCIVEWPDAAKKSLPSGRLDISFAHRGDNVRLLRIQPRGRQS